MHSALLLALLAVAVSPAPATAGECCEIHENLISLILLEIKLHIEEPNQTSSLFQEGVAHSKSSPENRNEKVLVKRVLK